MKDSTYSVEDVGKSQYNDTHHLLVQIIMMNDQHGTAYTVQPVSIYQPLFQIIHGTLLAQKVFRAF